MCWARSVETLTAREVYIAGLAVASDERIEAYVVYRRSAATAEIEALRSFVDDGGNVSSCCSRDSIWGPYVSRRSSRPSAAAWLERVGFRPVGTHRVYAATARS